jgi:hypothetical protein
MDKGFRQVQVGVGVQGVGEAAQCELVPWRGYGRLSAGRSWRGQLVQEFDGSGGDDVRSFVDDLAFLRGSPGNCSGSLVSRASLYVACMAVPWC